MITYIPEHLSKTNLPWISDILYHEKIAYTHPTGFTPDEYEYLIDLYDYFTIKGIKQPMYFWYMLPNYFNLSDEFGEALNILSPLIHKNISISLLAYDRDLYRLNKTNEIFINDPNIYYHLSHVDVDFRLFDRELLSHIWQVSLEPEFKDIVPYIKDITGEVDSFLINYYSILINKLLFFQSINIGIAIQNQTWLPLLKYLEKYSQSDNNIADSSNDSEFDLEHLKFRLFFELTSPIYGVCDSIKNSQFTLDLLNNKIDEIKALKNKCETIACELIKINCSDKAVLQKILDNELKKHVVLPLSDLIMQRKDKVEKILKSFVFDSTVIGAILSTYTNQVSMDTISVSLGAGLASSLGNNLIHKNNNLVNPDKFILNQLKK